MSTVEFIVGPRRYYVPMSCIEKYPNSYFAAALSPEWNKRSFDGICGCFCRVEVSDRDTELFQFVSLYLQFGTLPRDKRGDTLIDRKLLPALRDEADYFCLSEMVKEIDELLTSDYPACNYARDIVASMSNKMVLGLHEYDRYSKTGLSFHLNSIKTKLNEIYYNSDLCGSLSVDGHVMSLSDGAAHNIFEYSKDIFNCESQTFVKESKLLLSDDFVAAISTSIKLAKNETPSKLHLSKVLVSSPYEQYELHETPSHNSNIEGYVVMCLQSKFEGGDVLVTNTSTGVKFNWLTASKSAEGHVMMMFDSQSRFSVCAVSEGVQVLLIFEKLLNDDVAKTVLMNSCYLPGVFEPILNAIDEPSATYRNKYKSVGIFTAGDYLNNGFCVDNLIYKDKLLYEFALTNNLSIVLAYVMVNGTYSGDDKPRDSECVRALRACDVPHRYRDLWNGYVFKFYPFDSVHMKRHILYVDRRYDEKEDLFDMRCLTTAFIISKQ